MTDVFISYARSTERQAEQVANALRSLGYAVWRDDDLPAHRAYAEVIEERLSAAKAVVVLWSAEAAKSQWVRAEANIARGTGILVQLRLDDTVPPLPFNEIQCADLAGWAGDLAAPGWQKIVSSLAELTGAAGRPESAAAPSTRAARGLSVCVLPFVNMSGDAEQEYFSDGITEDIITDLSKVSALSVVARNTAFTFKGRSVKVPEAARELGVSHVLEGSVRKAGERVRITAQLIDGVAGDHVWAERYDRDLTDIFAVQDEISEAIVGALKLKLLPQEKSAIERRSTDSVEAYNLYLMARQYWLTGNDGDARVFDAIVRFCARAVEIDPDYAQAWALMAGAERALSMSFGRSGDGGWAAVEQALALDPGLAEAHAVKARLLLQRDRQDEANAEIATALRLDPDSFEVNFRAGDVSYRQRPLEEAVRHWEKATTLAPTNYVAPTLLVTCYTALGDVENARRAATLALVRAEKVLARDATNGHARACGVNALAVLGEAGRAKDWMDRALLNDPDNMLMRFNFACALVAQLHDADAALDMLRVVLERDPGGNLATAKSDPDLDPLRADPRFVALITAAETRVATG